MKQWVWIVVSLILSSSGSVLANYSVRIPALEFQIVSRDGHSIEGLPAFHVVSAQVLGDDSAWTREDRNHMVAARSDSSGTVRIGAQLFEQLTPYERDARWTLKFGWLVVASGGQGLQFFEARLLDCAFFVGSNSVELPGMGKKTVCHTFETAEQLKSLYQRATREAKKRRDSEIEKATFFPNLAMEPKFQ